MSIGAIGSAGSSMDIQAMQSMIEAMRTQVSSVSETSSVASAEAIGTSGADSASNSQSSSNSQNSNQQQQQQNFTPIDTTQAYQESAYRFAVDQAVMGSNIQAYTTLLEEANPQAVNPSNNEQNSSIDANNTNDTATSANFFAGVEADSFVSQISNSSESQNNYTQQSSAIFEEGTSYNTALAMGFSNYNPLVSSMSLSGFGGDNNQSGYLNQAMSTESASQASAVAALYSSQNQSQMPVMNTFQPVSQYV